MSAAASAFFQGLLTSLVLIVAIGSQNAFVLRQGLRREHVASVVLACALCDALLIAAGVAGMARLLQRTPALATVLSVLGAVFLLVYGLRALQRACRPGVLQAGAGAASTHAAVLAQAVAFSLLNPHVYLDTVLLLGSIGAQQAGLLQWVFVAGAAAASAAWFASLGFGARLLAPWFAGPRAWRVLDGLVACTMLALAGLLARRAWAAP